jgi:hypothetical protein
MLRVLDTLEEMLGSHEYLIHYLALTIYLVLKHLVLSLGRRQGQVNPPSAEWLCRQSNRAALEYWSVEKS